MNRVKSHLRNENPYRVIIGYININSIRNKFESLVSRHTYGIRSFAYTFLESQFLIEGFWTPYRLDRRAKGRGILLYIRQDIPSKYFKKSQ